MLRTGLTRENWRGRVVAFPSGALVVSVSVIALVPLAVLNDRADLSLLEPDLSRWAAYLLGIALLGLLDDMLGRGAAGDTARGWRGHAGAVLTGHLSTGAIKAVGAFGLAAFAVSGLGREWPGYLADLALLLLTTNLFNLLDLRPGRVEKALLLLLVGVCLGAWTIFPLQLLGVFIGPLLIGAALTLRERAMLGDCGREPRRRGRRRRPVRSAGNGRQADRADRRRRADDLRRVPLDLGGHRPDPAATGPRPDRPAQSPESGARVASSRLAPRSGGGRRRGPAPRPVHRR